MNTRIITACKNCQVANAIISDGVSVELWTDERSKAKTTVITRLQESDEYRHLIPTCNKCDSKKALVACRVIDAERKKKGN